MSSIQGPSAGSTQPSGSAENSKPAGNAKEAEKNKDDFDKALEKKGKGEKKGDGGLEDLFRQANSKKKKDTREDGGAMGGGDAAKAMNAKVDKTAEVQGVDNKAMIDKIDKIADKIMVSNAQDVKAVKVDFNSSVLPGTEVMIRKDATGKLNIEFTTTSADSFNFLNKGEQVLMDTLNRKIGGEISIDVKMQGGGADQDTGDGRSREQYTPDDDKDDKDKED